MEKKDVLHINFDEAVCPAMAITIESDIRDDGAEEQKGTI